MKMSRNLGPTLISYGFLILQLVLKTDAMSTPSYPIEEPKEVEGVEGASVQLPCDLFPRDQEDKINLILWYRNEGKDPIYSYDARLAVFSSERHHLKDSLLKGRVTFTPSPGAPIPHKLSLSRLQQVDAGAYTCRVDFTMAQSSNKGVLLRVVTPVNSLTIVDAQGRTTPSVLEPIPEGGTLNITCTAKGGRPQPSVSWWVADAMIDDSWTEVAKGVVSNNLVLSPLTRAHAHAVLTCRAAPSIVAVSTATVTIDMYLRPESVEITAGENSGTVRAGDYLDLTCIARGSRPAPIIMWYKGAEVIKTKKSSLKDLMGVSAVNHARVKVTKDDNGVRVTCRVTNPSLPHHTLQEYLTLNVTYPPEVELRMGSTLEGTVVRETTDLYLTCHVDGNPHPDLVTFTHQGVVVEQDVTRGIVTSGQDLVLRGIQRSQSGIYTCRASNTEGTGISPPINITVLYAPVCKEAPDVWAEPGSQVTATCTVNSSPTTNIHFSWVWMTATYSRRVTAMVTSEGLTSNLSFVIPQDNASISELGPINKLGTLECWARNEVGRQVTPCAINVRRPVDCTEPAGGDRSSTCLSHKKQPNRPKVPAPPSAPVNCTLTGVGRERVRVTCQPGDNRNIPQTYQLQIYEARTRKLHINVTSEFPSFLVPNLTAGRDYTVYVSSHTSHGGSPFKLVEAFNFKTAENRMRENELEPISWTSIMIFVGCVAGLILFIIFVVALIRLRLRRSQHRCTVRKAPSTTEPKLADKNLYLDTPPEVPPTTTNDKFGAEEVTVAELETSLTQKNIRDPLNPPPIIRQPTNRLQPIIKENGRAEPVRNSQPRTVLFVDPPPKIRSDALPHDDDDGLLRLPYEDLPYSLRRNAGLKTLDGEARTAMYNPPTRGSYMDTLPPYNDRGSDELYTKPQFTSGSSTGLGRESGYFSSRHPMSSSSYRGPSSMSAPSHENPSSMLPHRDPTHVFSFPAKERENIYDVPLHRTSSSPPPPRPSIMKKSPSVSGPMSRRYDSSRNPDGTNTYRSLPRPNKSRPYDGVMVKYRSLDRRFDIPFTGSLPRPEPKDRPRPERQLSLSDTRSDHRFDIRADHRSSSLRSDLRSDIRLDNRGDSRYDARSSGRSLRDTGISHGRSSGSARLRFANEKYFHVYPDKDKRQNCVTDDDDFV